jgi:hypothetical protein
MRDFCGRTACIFRRKSSIRLAQGRFRAENALLQLATTLLSPERALDAAVPGVFSRKRLVKSGHSAGVSRKRAF